MGSFISIAMCSSKRNPAPPKQSPLLHVEEHDHIVTLQSSQLPGAGRRASLEINGQLTRKVKITHYHHIYLR